MTNFSIQETAFTGFRVVREHPRALAIWAAFALVTSLAFNGILVGVAGPDVMRLQQLSVTEIHDPAVVTRAVSGVLPAYALLTPLVLIYYAVLYAAMNRAVLRPGEKKLGYLGFGGDELRQIGLMVMLGLCALGVYFALVVVVVLLGALLSVSAHLHPASIVLIAIPGVLIAFVCLAVRMSLASALTFQTGRVNVFGSWSLTRGHFWPLLGVYLLTFALSAVVVFLTYLVILAVVAVVTGGNMFAVMGPTDMRSPGAYFTIPQLVQLVLGAGVSALIWPIMLTPAAAICRHLLAEQAEPIRAAHS